MQKFLSLPPIRDQGVSRIYPHRNQKLTVIRRSHRQCPMIPSGENELAGYSLSAETGTDTTSTHLVQTGGTLSRRRDRVKPILGSHL